MLCNIIRQTVIVEKKKNVCLLFIKIIPNLFYAHASSCGASTKSFSWEQFLPFFWRPRRRVKRFWVGEMRSIHVFSDIPKKHNNPQVTGEVVWGMTSYWVDLIEDECLRQQRLYQHQIFSFVDFYDFFDTILPVQLIHPKRARQVFLFFLSYFTSNRQT